ncbi:MAG: hypothetical protein ACRDJM_08485, partial [Actinomycetota bacterium]
MRRIVVACAAAAVALAAGAVPAAAHVPAGRIVILTLDGTDIRDWTRARVPQIDALMREGAAALLSAKTAAPPPRSAPDCAGRSLHALETMLQGSPSTGVADRDLRDTALGRALARHGVTAGVARATVADTAFPGGMRTDVTVFARAIRNAPSVAILPVMDTLAADCTTQGSARAGWINLSLRRAGELIAIARSVADQVIVVSTVPPVARERAGNYLTAIAVTGGPAAGRTLRSATTRRDGVVALADVATTTTALLRLGEPVGAGNAVRAAGAADLPRLDARYSSAASMQRPFARGLAASGAVAAGLGFGFVLSGRGRSRRGR